MSQLKGWPAAVMAREDWRIPELPSQKTETRAKGPLAALVAALVLLVSVATLSFLGWQQYYNSAAETRQTIQQLFAVTNVMRDLEAAQNSVRAYELSGELAYARQAQGMIRKIVLRLPASASVDQLTSQQLHHWRTVVSGLVSELSKPVRRGDGISGAASVARLDQQMELMEQARLLADQIQPALETRLNAQRLSTRQYARWAQLSASFGCMGVFGILLATNTNIRRLLRTREVLNRRLMTANEDLQQFIFSASHDLQEPLRTLRIFSDSLESKLKAQRPIERELYHLRTAAEQMSTLIADLLTFTEISSEPAELRGLTDMDQVLRSVLRDLHEAITESGAMIHHSNLSPLPIAPAHAGHLLRNLIANAVRYRAGERPVRIQIETTYSNKQWTVSVTDNGIGISPEYHQHIFGIFKRLHTRTEHPGTGLGLAICRKIVERYGGRIWVESVMGQGSTFFFTLPDNADQKRTFEAARGRSATALSRRP